MLNFLIINIIYTIFHFTHFKIEKKNKKKEKKNIYKRIGGKKNFYPPYLEFKK
jgi:hypothetical protein